MYSWFKVLEVINKQPNLSQKKIGELSGISSGKVNLVINQLIKEGYLVSEKSGRNMNYFLTDRGVEFFKQGIEEYQQKKVNIHSKPKKEIKEAVILAAGQTKEFDRPVSLLELGDITLLKRHLRILKENGIEKIVIVTGYKKEAFDFLEEMDGVYVTENNRFKWTGSMASLACAYEHISDDFLLIEHDVLTEENTFKQLIDFPQRDCILLTKESGSGDEAFVELRNGYLYKISKDIHQFNRIDGEIVGISKLSYEVFTKMLQEYENNKNPYLNYEYLLLDVARQYDIGHIRINDLVWAEIDTMEHFNHVKNVVYPRLKRKEAEFKKNFIQELVADALRVTKDEIGSIEPFGGMTNKNFKVILMNGNQYVLRIPGAGTEQMINRYEEKINSYIASAIGIDAALVYFNEDTGVKISELISNAETLNPKTAKREDNMKLTAGVLRTLHQSHLKMENDFDIMAKIEQYEKIARDVNGQFYPDYADVKKRVIEVRQLHEKINVEYVPCHNDTVPENFVKSGENQIYLIDWEYSGSNDPMWDLAAHSLECGFSEEDEELFLSHYFEKEEITNELKDRVLINKIFQDFLWSTWTIIKEAKGDSFGSYGIERYTRAKKNIELLLAR
ncbi:NTP transferase domain-containing protein [Fredinandcohnia sp. 179-A 10B2 NHS]|uniref:NTP transferase domain-containing protein n=1 Tax=Fredinandcohnia sp. 179-A 10B2 NHS TaxID=3235176 RepID=UPI0039A0FDFF